MHFADKRLQVLIQILYETNNQCFTCTCTCYEQDFQSVTDGMFHSTWLCTLWNGTFLAPHEIILVPLVSYKCPLCLTVLHGYLCIAHVYMYTP